MISFPTKREGGGTVGSGRVATKSSSNLRESNEISA